MGGVGESIFLQAMSLEKKNQRVTMGTFLSVCLIFVLDTKNVGEPSVSGIRPELTLPPLKNDV